MKPLTTRTIVHFVALLALLALLPIGSAGAQRPEPPPPVAPFGETLVATESVREPLFALGSPAVTAGFQAGGDRLVEMQAWDGGWGWPLNPPTNPTASPLNTIGPIGMGLTKAFEHTGDAAMYAALQDAGALLLTKNGNFSPSDGYLAGQLDGLFGVTTYTDYVKANFYGLLETGDYYKVSAPAGYYDTQAYVDLIRTSRASQGIPNIAAWDVGMGLVGALWVGIPGDEINIWIAGTQAEINELDGSLDYDVIGLSGGLYGLAMAGAEFDPTAGEHAAAWDLDGLAQILISYQLGTGGFTWNSLYQGEGEDNETTQETAYALLALNQLDRATYLPTIIRAADWLYGFQAASGTGGWLSWAGGGENNEITGEALWALDAGYPVGDVWVCQTGNCGHPEAFYNTIQEGVDNVNLGGTVHVLADDDEDYGLNVPYTEQVIITRSLQLYGAGAANTIIAAPGTLPAASQQDSAIVIVEDGASVEITGFTVTGPGPTSCGSIRAGIFVRGDADANIHDNIIADIRDDVLPLSGCQNGVGILVGRQFWSTSGTATITDNVFTGYQKGGIVVDNVGSDAIITNNTLTGIDTTDITAQNGIQVSRGATATLSGNTVTLHSYYDATDPVWSWGASGILLYQAGAVTFTGTNTATGNDQNLSIVDGTALDLDTMVLGGSPAPAGTGMDIYNDGTAAIDATGVTFTGAVTCADIEDRVYHKLDDVDLGLVTWLANTVCVTQDSGSIQNGIDASSAGGTVLVFPGNYDETASNRILLGGATSSGTVPYQFGLFFPIDKPGLTVKGVDAAQVDLTDPEDVDLPYVTTNASNNFGPSNFWIEGDNVTVQGLRQGPNNVAFGENKSVEIVADGVTLRYFKSDLPDGGGSVYINDWLYSAGVSTVESFHIDQSNFDDGTQVGVFSGAGVSGDVSGRTITNNSFNFDPLLVGVNWPAISFSGSGTGVPWFVHPVGGAVITGNDFSGSTMYIRSRGTVEEADFDWDSYWNDNTFDKKVMAGANPPLLPRAFTYTCGSYSCPNTRVIGAFVLPEIGHAIAGDTVLVGSGTYLETGQLLIDKNLSVVGEDPLDKPVIQPTAAWNGVTAAQAWWLVNSGVTFNLTDVVLDGTGFDMWVALRNHGTAVVDGVDFQHLKDLAAYRGFGIASFGGTVPGGLGSSSHGSGGPAASLTVTDSTFMDIGRVGVLIKGTDSDATITGSTYTGKGSGDWLDYGVEVGAGGSATIGGPTAPDGNTISGNTGLAGDGSTSACILVTDYYGTGTTATILNNTLTGCTTGIAVGFDNTDASTVVAHYNKFLGNTDYGVSTTAPAVNAEMNWWGSGLGPDAPDNTYGLGDAVTVNVDYRDWCGNIGCTLALLAPNANDFDGDGKTDAAVFEKATGNWFVVGSNSGYFTPALNFGANPALYTTLPGDYDGDGEMDAAVFELATGNWFAVGSMTGYFTPALNFGAGSAYTPLPGDYDGDGMWDAAVFEKATGNWFVVGSTAGFFTPALNFGNDTDFIPVPADYDGDGTTDPAVYEKATGNWFAIGSTDGPITPALALGGSSFLPVPGDYDGDGTTDAAVFEKATGNWYVAGSTLGFYSPALGFGDATNYLPVPSDYDGDGMVDPAVFERATGNWFVVGSDIGFFTPALNFGNDTTFVTAIPRPD